ncbi:DUF302 domain-containing protein [Pontibacter sp. G13]|uniref:DUF302 domain-containing protein n=1 Tax=Pontibacter sp. G13 TaxID=3074898 RepID=UPI00288B6543|nr:DUF302 domain-containing protein [Pontibacter sp. G13]WNJ20980.1 DUF302 domain-containing protein [Pontibacter sp. G13]
MNKQTILLTGFHYMRKTLLLLGMILVLGFWTYKNRFSLATYSAPNVENLPEANGLMYVESELSYSELAVNLYKDTMMPVFQEIDFQQIARENQQYIPPTTTLFYLNTPLTVKLIQLNPLIGLDLPVRLTLYQTERQRTFLTSMSPQYLLRRYGLNDPKLNRELEGYMNELFGLIGEEKPDTILRKLVVPKEGIKMKMANGSFEEVLTRFEQAIERNSHYRKVFELDYVELAQEQETIIPPTKLFVAGNLVDGITAVQGSQTLGLDEIPQKLLVFERDGEVWIAYNDLAYNLKRHRTSLSPRALNNLQHDVEWLVNQVAGDYPQALWTRIKR